MLTINQTLASFCGALSQLAMAYFYRVVQKTAQRLWHNNFATVHHKVMRSSAKCSERNSLHDQNQCL